jgi:hypothetical protein
MMSSRTRVVAVVLASTLLLAWAAVSRSQSQVPGTATPGSAPVLVVNEVKTQATQAGAWQVSLAPATAVGLTRDASLSATTPDFLKTGQRYLVHPANEPTVLCVFDRIDHGWLHAAGEGGKRWLSLSQIVSIQEAQ